MLDERLLTRSLTRALAAPAAAANLTEYLDNGGDANRSVGAWSLLSFSAHHGWEEVTRRILGSDSVTPANTAWPLYLAARRGHATIVRLLLAHGTDVSAYKNAALRWSATAGHTDIVRLLLAAGAGVHASNNNVTLRMAATNGHTDVVRLLFAHGADIHANNDAPLLWAAAGQHKTTTEVLLMAGANAVAAIEHAAMPVQNAILATIDACAAAIPVDQRQELSKSFGKQLPALAALIQQEQRRARRGKMP